MPQHQSQSGLGRSFVSGRWRFSEKPWRADAMIATHRTNQSRERTDHEEAVPRFIWIGTVASEIEAAFRNSIKAHSCPACGMPFTDYAINWGDAWREGYMDSHRENGWTIRDGPFKLKCESCNKCSWYNVFGNRVGLAEERD